MPRAQRRSADDRGDRLRRAQRRQCLRARGYFPDEIVELYPDLTLEDVHTALAYYYANVEDFRDAMADAADDEAGTPA